MKPKYPPCRGDVGVTGIRRAYSTHQISVSGFRNVSSSSAIIPGYMRRCHSVKIFHDAEPLAAASIFINLFSNFFFLRYFISFTRSSSCILCKNFIFKKPFDKRKRFIHHYTKFIATVGWLLGHLYNSRFHEFLSSCAILTHIYWFH